MAVLAAGATRADVAAGAAVLIVGIQVDASIAVGIGATAGGFGRAAFIRTFRSAGTEVIRRATEVSVHRTAEADRGTAAVDDAAIVTERAADFPVVGVTDTL